MKNLNRITLYVALLCILIATTVSIMAIWQVVIDTQFLLRTLMTLGVIFLATLLTFAVNNLIPMENGDKQEKDG